MIKKLYLYTFCLFFLAVTSFGDQQKSQTEYVPGEWVIKFKDEVRSQQEVLNLQQNVTNFLKTKLGQKYKINITVLQTTLRYNKVKITPIVDLNKIIQILKSHPLVEYAEPNYIYRAFLSGLPNDLDFSKLWGLYNTGQKDSAGQIGVPGSDIGVLPLWDQGLLGSHDIIVAVIDTGVQWDHPDLKENIYVNPGEIAGNGKDDDGNGFVDDVSGWNFITKQGNSQDDNGHGTHVSGTIGALGNNETGVVGVNWHVSILPIKFLSASGSGTLEDAVEAIRYATKMKAKIMSNSWGGGGFSQAMLDAIVEARNAGILFVAAAGNSATDNDSTPMYPASYSAENVIAVAATDNQDKLADFSCFGKKTVHVAAPGVNIYSTVKGSSYDTYSGTSMATPHISGIAALLWSANPDWTFDVIKQRLIQTSTPIRALKSKVAARGRVNIFNAYYNIIPPNDEPGENEWLTEDRALESEHPYKDNQNLTWTIEKSGVKYLRVYFENVSVEKRYDHVYVEDAVGIAVNDLTGSFQNYTSDYVDGEVIKIRLKTDVNITDYGFKITKIQYVPKK